MAETVAFLFSDVEGSTRLLAALGASTYGDLLGVYRAVVEEASLAEDGQVVDREGDGLFVVFPTVTAALRAALTAQRAIRARDWPEGRDVRVRMGIHAGQAERRDDGWVGLAVHRAARLASAGHGGQVLMSEAAQALAAADLPPGVGVLDLGRHLLKDLQHPERVYQLTGSGLATHLPPLRTASENATNLPIQPTSFVGRTSELGEVARLLDEHRLLTLTGVGGAGKSRLAAEAAGRRLGRHADGVWLVELAALTEAEGLTSGVAAALSIRDEDALDTVGTTPDERLVQQLAGRDLLLLLDNCEHVVDEVSRVVDRLLRACPRIQILATSREALGVAGEAIWRVPSLSLVEDDIEGSDAVQLFAARARAVMPSFTLSGETLPAIVQICTRLDGLPLAIELAAARMRMLSADQIAARLDDRFRLLTGGSRTALPRQQTLEATIAWSVQLLNEAERTLFTRLSVFAGTFSLEAAEEVSGGGALARDEIMDTLFHLVDKSLVAQIEEAAGDTRYRLPETLRQYARAQLAASGAAGEFGLRHMEWCQALTADVWERALGGGKAELAETLDREADNLQAALEFARTHAEARAVVHLSQALAWRWYLIGHLGTAVMTLRTLLQSLVDVPVTCLARALLARCLAYSEDIDGARREAEAAHDLLGNLDSPLAKVWVVETLRLVIFMSVDADPQRMLSLADEAAAIAIPCGDAHAELIARQVLADAYCLNGRSGEGLEQQRIALDMAARTGDVMTIHQIFGQSIYNYMLDPVVRRSEPRHIIERWLSLVPLNADAWRSVATDWLPWVYLQDGDLARAEQALDAMAGRTLEGYNRTIHLVGRATVAWMRGLVEVAWSDIRELSTRPINPRWAHSHYPLVAEVAADLGRLDDVRRLADTFLAMRLHATREATKLGALGPLVRAEVDAALADGADDHARQAQASFDEMQRILREHPPRVDSWWSIMTHTQNLAFAAAELSRLSGSSPELWAEALRVADYAYYQIYARWRLGEALLGAGDARRGAEEIRSAHADAIRVGAELLEHRLRSTARQHGVVVG